MALLEPEELKLKIEYIAVESLIPYINNPKTHPSEQVDKIASSIKNFGFIVPIIIDDDNEIVAGHGRLLASEKLGLKKVPCIRVKHLPPAQVKAFRIADNRTAESEWDTEILTVGLEELDDLGVDLSLTAFDDDELDELLNTDFEKIEEEDFDFEESLEEKAEAETEKGGLYRLGRHLLLCGDCTEEESYRRLLKAADGDAADFVFTDPPYNINFEYKEYEDDKRLEEYRLFCETWFSLLSEYSSGRIIITPGKQNLGMWYEIEPWTDVAAWIARNKMSGGKVSNLALWEPLLFYGDANMWEPIIFYGAIDRGSRATDVYEYNVGQQKDVGDHPCPKPLKMIADIVSAYTRRGEIILDVFGGSGTTLIAAEHLGRSCCMIEMDPHYCDVIISRWEKFSDSKAEKL